MDPIGGSLETIRNLTDLTGTTLAGRFELRELLGQGGYGAVFEAEQLSMGRRCAVKVLAPREGMDSKTTARFEMEARATSKLSHPNTITIFDFGEDEDAKVFFIAMEYVEGEDLSGLLRRGGLPVEDALHVLEQAAGSLDDAHRHGIIHRDVKPQNMMICPRPGDPLALKVIDFGIAKAMGTGGLASNAALTMTGTIVGTPQYMSPEQVRDIELDGRSDQYSLAVCAYEMLAGRPPFGGTSPIDIATKHLTDTALPLSVVQPELNIVPEFDDALLKALSKQPDDRFDSCIAFVRALKAAHLGTTVSQTVMSGSQSSELRSQRLANELSGPIAAQMTPAPISVGTASVEIPALGDPRAATGPALDVTAEMLSDEPGHTVAVSTQSGPVQGPMQTGPIAGSSIPMMSGSKFRVAIVVALVVVVAVVLAWQLFGSSPQQDATQAVDNNDGQALAPQAVVEQPPPEVETPAETPVVEAPVAAAAVVEVPVAEVTAAQVGTTDAGEEPASREHADSEVQTTVESGEAKRRFEVTVTIRPWGTLYVDGRSHGTVPRQTIQLTEGRHTFDLRQDGRIKDRKVVDVSSSSLSVHLLATPK